MKNTKLIVAMAAVLCLASCDFGQPGTNKEEKTSVDSVAAVVSTKADDVPMTIDKDGLSGMKFGSEIPDTLEGCSIEPLTYMAEGEEQVKYVVKKGDELLLEIEPGFDFEKMEFTKTVDVINIYSDRYQNLEHFHVGSNINDVLEAYPGKYTTHLFVDGNVYVDLGGIQFMAVPEDYAGVLPEVTSDEGAIIKNPTFKSDAKVKMIRLYSTK